MDQREGAFARGADNMKERPILFSAPMVRAILDGRKTQTRRVVKPQPTMVTDKSIVPWNGDSAVLMRLLYQSQRGCPYGHPGDRLWVRESGWERPERTAKMMREGADTWPRFAYAADDWSDQDRADFKAWGFKARPSIHMPRWASRITLEITRVRVERLQEISEADAIAEGVTIHNGDESCDCGQRIFNGGGDYTRYTATSAYRDLWESINGLGSWHPNPWVWVVEFKRVTA